jgi:aspartokinase
MTNELMETALQTYEVHRAAGGFACTTQENQPLSGFIQSIEFKRGLSIVTLTSTRRLKAFAFLHRVFEAFERHQIHYDFVTVSEIAVSVVLENPEMLDAIEPDLDGAGKVKVERDKAIVSLVADKVRFSTDVASQIFQAIEKINVNLISQSDSGKKLTFVVNESEIERVAFSLFEEFFEKKNVSKAVAQA